MPVKNNNLVCPFEFSYNTKHSDRFPSLKNITVKPFSDIGGRFPIPLLHYRVENQNAFLLSTREGSPLFHYRMFKVGDFPLQLKM
jgi:hypothetical protein